MTDKKFPPLGIVMFKPASAYIVYTLEAIFVPFAYSWSSPSAVALTCVQSPDSASAHSQTRTRVKRHLLLQLDVAPPSSFYTHTHTHTHKPEHSQLSARAHGTRTPNTDRHTHTHKHILARVQAQSVFCQVSLLLFLSLGKFYFSPAARIDLWHLGPL